MRSFLTFIMGVACLSVTGQNINDVLRYGTENLQGTARFQAMSGAFGALGGDLSGLNANPAGSAVFNYSQFGISGTNYNNANEVTYGSSIITTEFNVLDINQAGGVFVFKSPNSPWKKIALALNYDIANQYDDEIFAAGNSNQGVDNYFLNFAQGEQLGPLRVQQGEFIEDAYLDIGSSLGFGAQQAFLGFQSGIIEPLIDEDSNTAYDSNAQYSSVNQQYRQITNGYNSKFTANLAGQYQDNLYLGASLNFHSILYDRFTFFEENGYDEASAIQNTTFDNFLRTQGTGFSFNLGAITRLNDNIRVGGSYQSPTWYRLTDDTAQRINTNIAVNDIGFIDFNIVNLFEAYTIKIPSKLTGSLAVVFGKDGLLSFDYSYQDMSQAELRPNSDLSFNSENDFISNQLNAVNTYRVGGEYRIERFSLRGGYRLEESPYETEGIIGDLEGYSGGIGYDFGGSKLDLAVNRSEREISSSIFDGSTSNNILVGAINTNVTLTYTLKF